MESDNKFRCMICNALAEQKFTLKFTKETCDKYGWEYDEGISSVMICSKCWENDTSTN